MLIDWFTVIAQVVNFLILVWLMKRFLYAPVLDAIDAREQRIAASLADALAKQREAQRQHDEYRAKNDDFERQRQALFNTAMSEAEAERQRLFAEAREAHEGLRARLGESLHNDFLEQKDEIMRLIREEVFAIARKTLDDLATESLEQQMVDSFIRRLRTLSEEERLGLQTAFEMAAGPGLVLSAFPLPKAQQQELERTVRQAFAFAGLLRFETSPDLVSGIALSVNGYEVAWSIADYLPSLERSIAAMLSVRVPGEELTRSNSDVAGSEDLSGSNAEHGADGHG